MLLSMAEAGKTYRVLGVHARKKLEDQLHNLGFVPDATIEVTGSIRQNMIVMVKQCRLGLGQDMAQKIQVEELPLN